MPSPQKMAYRFAVVTTKPGQINAVALSIRLMALLETMPNHAGKEDVHRLRTTVRRLEAQLGNCPAKLAESLKTLRREAGKARDVDVHIALLKTVRLPKTAVGCDAGRSAREKLGEILKEKRERHVGVLIDLAAEAAPLLKAKLPLLAEQAGLATPSEEDAHQLSGRALKRFLQWTRSIPEDPNRLHRLRIKIKKLRYLLEPLEKYEDSAELTAKLKLVQDAIGSWHDWATLQQLAARELKRSGAEPICSILRARTRREYRRARRAAQSVREWASGGKAVEP